MLAVATDRAYSLGDLLDLAPGAERTSTGLYPHLDACVYPEVDVCCETTRPHQEDRCRSKASRCEMGYVTRGREPHCLYTLDGVTIPIPRHSELGKPRRGDLQGVSGRTREGMVAEVKTYHAEVSRDGKFWLIRIAEIDRSTQAIRYRDIPTMAGDLIEIMTGLGTEEYDLHIHVQLPTEVRDHLARAEALRGEAERKNSEAAREKRAAVRALLSRGLSQREAGELLGMSFQRISQLVKP